MAIRISLRHTTEYAYEKPVRLSPQLVRLRPAPHTRTPLHQYSLKVSPENHFVNWQQDPFGNHVARLVFAEPTSRFEIDVSVTADLVTINPFDFFIEDIAQTCPFQYPAQLRKELAPYFETTDGGSLLDDWVATVDAAGAPTVDFLVALNQRLERDIGYVIRMEPGVQKPEETLRLGKGSCRDSGWLLVQILRRLGLAARFVSGYLVQLRPDVESLDGPSGAAEDFTDLHAWTEVFVPGAGWIGLDPTSGLFAGEGHIPLACTPDPVSAAPITGSYLGDPVEGSFHYRNEVTRIHEDPRVTFPYTQAQWSRVMALGKRIDATLDDGDVRLTMGGEPTFVSIDDMDTAQWNTAALGEHKLERATILLRRLAARWAPGGVLHYGQGKWYPGEPLPRWAFGCFWREDGGVVWRDPALLADPDKQRDANAMLAARFTDALASKLGIDVDNAIPGHEDGLYYLWKEGSLPINADVLDSKLRDPLERRRLRRLFDRGLDEVVG
ncbi:MAG: IMP dehydrogenase, partial [Proteobacteria bacterium]